MNEIINYVKDNEEDFVSMTFNTPHYKSNENFKISITKINDKKIYYQISVFYETKVKHENIFDFNILLEKINIFLENGYKNIIFSTSRKTIQILTNKKGNYKMTSKDNNIVLKIKNHNDEKNYIIKDGENISWLKYLGIINENGFVKKEKSKKFKQINKFLEIVSQIESNIPENATIIDFGSGKSYLTFALYYYLNIVKGKNAEIIGLDLKTDVIEYCNKVTEDLGFEKLKFMAIDIKDFKTDKPIDMVVSLHACDTATDYAIYNAIKWESKIIMCVPCCQKEIFGQIRNDELNIILKHGILKERFSSLLTDSMRASLMEAWGYKTTVMEFIDMEHTPKNILIRGIFTGKKSEKDLKEFLNIKNSFNIKQSLYELLNEN